MGNILRNNDSTPMTTDNMPTETKEKNKSAESKNKLRENKRKNKRTAKKKKATLSVVLCIKSRHQSGRPLIPLPELSHIPQLLP